MPRASALRVAAVVLAAAAAALLPSAAAHGMLEAPVARNVLSRQAQLQWDPQSLSGGGAFVLFVQDPFGAMCLFKDVSIALVLVPAPARL